jgi:hypothetical protein
LTETDAILSLSSTTYELANGNHWGDPLFEEQVIREFFYYCIELPVNDATMKERYQARLKEQSEALVEGDRVLEDIVRDTLVLFKTCFSITIIPSLEELIAQYEATRKEPERQIFRRSSVSRPRVEAQRSGLVQPTETTERWPSLTEDTWQFLYENLQQSTGEGVLCVAGYAEKLDKDRSLPPRLKEYFWQIHNLSISSIELCYLVLSSDYTPATNSQARPDNFKLLLSGEGRPTYADGSGMTQHKALSRAWKIRWNAQT